MKQRLLELLVCPDCKRAFSVSNVTLRSGEIEEGTLNSECGSSYPILRGIPRLLPDAATYNSLAENNRKTAGKESRFRSNLERTRKSFGFQWTMFRKIDESDMGVFLAKTLWSRDSFRGKLILDAGCGFGRYTYFSAKFGAEVVGVDLSAAIDSARLNTHGLSNVHLIQGDLLNLPFPDGCFDKAYSIGVLHHTPDPAATFRSVAASLRPGGEFAIWVYDRADVVRETINTFLRAVAKRLPHPALWKICGLAARLSYIRQTQRLRNYVIIGGSRVGNFDWYSPEFQHHLTEADVYSWFKTNGFCKMHLISPPVRGFGSSFGAKGIKSTLPSEQQIIVEKVTTSFDKLVDSDMEGVT